MENENRTQRRPDEHRRGRDEAAADIRIRAARKIRIGGKSCEGQRQDRRGQVGYTQAACSGVLQAHGERKKYDEGIGGDSTAHIGRRKRYNERGTDSCALRVGCEREKSATMLPGARPEAASGKGPQQER